MDLKDYGFEPIDFARFDAIGKPYTIYAELLDAETQNQFAEVLRQPYVTRGALMPDAHAGYSMPIGGVCATREVIVPQFVGFDIGCGMCAYRTGYDRTAVEEAAQSIYDGIVETVPLGFNTHKHHQSYRPERPMSDLARTILESIGRRQLGTLGGGNHFIEIGYDTEDDVWIIIHSGSRGLGHKIASHYMLEAYLQENPAKEKLTAIVADWEARNVRFKEANPEQYARSLQKFTHKQTLALERKMNLDNLEGIYGLQVDSDLGRDYIMDQAFALSYALENRKRMIEAVHGVMGSVLGGEAAIDFDDETRFINRNHNHAEYDPRSEEWIHRKGATHAEEGMMGVIPGNMRDGSFIVRGRGHPDALNSSSHGAGRVMSRVQAKRTVAFEDFQTSMRGITGTVDPNTLDESPFAYKDIFEVMALQHELVEVVEHVKPIINVKDNTKQRY